MVWLFMISISEIFLNAFFLNENLWFKLPLAVFIKKMRELRTWLYKFACLLGWKMIERLFMRFRSKWYAPCSWGKFVGCCLCKWEVRGRFVEPVRSVVRGFFPSRRWCRLDGWSSISIQTCWIVVPFVCN